MIVFLLFSCVPQEVGKSLNVHDHIKPSITHSPYKGRGVLVGSYDRDRQKDKVKSGRAGIPVHDQELGFWWDIPRGAPVFSPSGGRVAGIKKGVGLCKGEAEEHLAVYIQLDPGTHYQVGLTGVIPHVSIGQFVEAGEMIGVVSGERFCGSTLALVVWSARTKSHIDPFGVGIPPTSLLQLSEKEEKTFFNTERQQ